MMAIPKFCMLCGGELKTDNFFTVTHHVVADGRMVQNVYFFAGGNCVAEFMADCAKDGWVPPPHAMPFGSEPHGPH